MSEQGETSNIINVSNKSKEQPERVRKLKSERKGVENAWNTDIPKFEKGDMKGPLLAETSFKVNFPNYRTGYLKQCFPLLKTIMKVSFLILADYFLPLNITSSDVTAVKSIIYIFSYRNKRFM